MDAKVEALYGRIGQALTDLVGADFKRAFARVEMAHDFGSVGVFYDPGDGAFRYLTDDDDVLFEHFADLRRACASAGMGEWSQATFALGADGKFSLQFGFDDVSDLGQGSARRDRWMKEHLGPSAKVIWS